MTTMAYISKGLICDYFGNPITGVTRTQARENCKKLGGRLPTLADVNLLAPDTFRSTPGMYFWLDNPAQPGNDCFPFIRPTDTTYNAFFLFQNKRDPYLGFCCVWESLNDIPKDLNIHVVEVPKPKKVLGYLAKEPFKAFGVYLRGLTYGEAEAVARQLDAEVPTSQVYDALGDTPLLSGL